MPTEDDAQVSLDVVWAELLATRRVVALQTKMLGELLEASMAAAKISAAQSKLILMLVEDWEKRLGK